MMRCFRTAHFEFARRADDEVQSPVHLEFVPLGDSSNTVLFNDKRRIRSSRCDSSAY
jgi:hypothetical protein